MKEPFRLTADSKFTVKQSYTLSNNWRPGRKVGYHEWIEFYERKKNEQTLIAVLKSDWTRRAHGVNISYSLTSSKLLVMDSLCHHEAITFEMHTFSARCGECKALNMGTRKELNRNRYIEGKNFHEALSICIAEAMESWFTRYGDVLTNHLLADRWKHCLELYVDSARLVRVNAAFAGLVDVQLAARGKSRKWVGTK